MSPLTIALLKSKDVDLDKSGEIAEKLLETLNTTSLYANNGTTLIGFCMLLHRLLGDNYEWGLTFVSELVTYLGENHVEDDTEEVEEDEPTNPSTED